MSILQGLNPNQKAAVETVQGPLLVLAGPGSGKTRVLTIRIAHMLNQGVSPYNILALTFTNKAAKEMKERIEHFTSQNARSIAMGTFHSVFARILRTESKALGYPSNFTIYDADDAKSVVKKILKEFKYSDNYKPSTVYNRISSAKNQLMTAAEYAASTYMVSDDSNQGRPDIHKVYTEYEKRCKQAGAMDFDDLLLNMHHLLKNHPEILAKYRKKFQYVLIDEFQDTNPAQYSIVKMIAHEHTNICAVGDDAQSIYAFRGADIENILFLEKDFPNLKTYKLEQNYRSTDKIVAAANHIIQNNKRQLQKTIWTEKTEGRPISVLFAQSDNEEGKTVADAIFEESMRNHVKYSEVAILYRTNAQSRSFEESLRKLNIPYRIYGGTSFYSRKEVKDVMAYLRVIVNPDDEEALMRIINYPTRGIGATTLEKIIFLARQHNVSVWTILQHIHTSNLAKATISKIQKFMDLIQHLMSIAKTSDAYTVAVEACKVSGLLKSLHADKTVEGLSRYENVESLLNSIMEFTQEEPETVDEAVSLDKSLGSYLQSVSLLTDADNESENPDQVSLMTVHAAKGLEFQVVFVGGMEENLFPSMLATQSNEEIEEERRLFYVAATRAKEKLYLTSAATRYKYGTLHYSEPSRFLKELPEEDIEIIGRNPLSQGPSGSPKLSASALISGNKTLKTATAQSFKGRKTITGAPLGPKKPSVGPPKPGFVPQKLTDLKEGEQVEHERFGVGQVAKVENSSNGSVANVYFEQYGTKRIMLKFAKMKRL